MESESSTTDAGIPQTADMSQLLEGMKRLETENTEHKTWRQKAASLFSGKADESEDPFERDVVKPAKERGYGLTATLAETVRDLKKGSVSREEYDELKKALEEVKAQSNPENAVDAISFYSVGKHIIDAVRNNYPDIATDAKSFGKFQKLIGESIMGDIKEMKESDPMAWVEFRRDPQAQKDLVLKSITRFIPTSMRNRMRDEHEASKPITADALAEAWKLAGRIKDPEKQENFYAEIRAEARASGNLEKFLQLITKK